MKTIRRQGSTGFSLCWHRGGGYEAIMAAAGPGDGFGRSVSRKNGQRRPILDKTEFGPRSQPCGAVLERRRSRLGGFGQNPHPPCLWALLSFYREGRRGAGSHSGGVLARLPDAENVPGDGRRFYNLAGAADAQFADR